MIGKTISHFTPWDKRVGIFLFKQPNAYEKTDIQIQ